MKKLFFLLGIIFLLTACSGEAPVKSAGKSDSVAASKTPFPSILPLLQQTWVETRDSLHVIDLNGMVWTDLYNGDTVSERPYQLYDKDPAKGGVQADYGRFLYLQEDSANFYLMEIEALDSNRLALHFLQAEIRYEFKVKGKGMDN